MKALELMAYGAPQDSVRLYEAEEPGPLAAGEALIQMLYSPINHIDILAIKGVFSFGPELPLTTGGQGVGSVLAVGPYVTSVKPGDTVVIPLGIGSWSQRIVVPASALYIVPSKIDIKHAALLGMNLSTAIVLLSEFVTLEKGSWVVFNAANSAMGRNIIAVAKSRGMKTLGVVRRQDAVAAVQAAGADAVLVNSPNIAQEAFVLTCGANIELALDVVGGKDTNALAKIVGADSHIVVYGFLSGGDAVISQSDLMGKKIKIHGFSMYDPQTQSKIIPGLHEMAVLLEEGGLSVPSPALYSLSEFREAIAYTLNGGTALFDLTI